MSQTEIIRTPTGIDFDFDISRSAPTRNFHHPYNGYNPITQTGRGGVKANRRIRAWSNANIVPSLPKIDSGGTFIQDILAASPIRIAAEPMAVPSLLQQPRFAEKTPFSASAPVSQLPVSSITAAPETKKGVLSVNSEHPFGHAGLPALLHGAPATHMQAGIDAAFKSADEGAIDAEKAFFVADLSVVYEQHERWLKALPEVQPFYGKSRLPATCLFSDSVS